MRFLFLVSDAFGGSGGIAKFNGDFIEALCSHPYCSEVVTVPRYMLLKCKPIIPKLKYNLNGLGGKSKFIKTVLREVFTNPNFELVICGHIYFLPFAILIKTILGVPLLLVIHGIDAWKPKNYLMGIFVKKVDFFLSVSKITQLRFLSWTKLKNPQFFILPNSVDLKNFFPGPKNAELIKRYGLDDKKILMTVGRLDKDEKYKGVDEVLDLMSSLLNEIPDLLYLIIGEGNDRGRLEQKANSLGLEINVKFLGMISEKEKVDHFRLADVFIMPSKGEGFGIVFLEAIACGVPVIGSKIDGSSEALLEGKLGKLVHPDDPCEIKTAIIDSLKLTKRIVPKELEKYSIENFKVNCQSILNEIIVSKNL